MEILPTSIVVPAGYTVGADDPRQATTNSPAQTGERLSNFKNELTGCGPFLHDDPDDRPAEVFENEVTVTIGGEQGASVLLPIVPEK